MITFFDLVRDWQEMTEDEVRAVSSYIAKLTLQCVGSLFTGATVYSLSLAPSRTQSLVLSRNRTINASALSSRAQRSTLSLSLSHPESLTGLRTHSLRACSLTQSIDHSLSIALTHIGALHDSEIFICKFTTPPPLLLISNC